MPATSPTLVVLLVHAVLSALLLSVFSVEVFEYPKLLLLWTAALALGVAGAHEWLRGAGRRPGLRSVLRDPLLWCGVAFVASGVISGLHGMSPRRSLLGAEARFQGVATWLAYAALFVAARRVAAARASAVAALLFASAAASAGAVAYGSLQALGFDPVAWSSLHQFREQLRPAPPSAIRPSSGPTSR